MVRWELVSFVRRSEQRRKILKLLDKPITPSRLADETKMYLTHVSRTLRELNRKDLVECLTPNEKIERYYRITKLGRNVLKHVDKMKE